MENFQVSDACTRVYNKTLNNFYDLKLLWLSKLDTPFKGLSIHVFMRYHTLFYASGLHANTIKGFHVGGIFTLIFFTLRNISVLIKMKLTILIIFDLLYATTIPTKKSKLWRRLFNMKKLVPCICKNFYKNFVNA